MYEKTYQHRVLKTDTQSKQRRSFPWKRVLITIGVVGVLAGIVTFIRAPRFHIQKVQVVGTSVADPIEVSDFVMSQLQGNYLWILPKTSVILISPDALTRSVAAHFPRFKSVAVARDGVSGLMVTVTEYPGVYLWCDSTDVCSFMDEIGTVFADAPYFSGSAYLKIYVGDRAAYPFHPIAVAQIAMVKNIEERLQTMEIAPLAFSFDSDRELGVTFFHNGSQVNILFDPADNITLALDTLYTGLRTQPLMRLYHDPTQVLQYLDVRFANKLVYKFQ